MTWREELGWEQPDGNNLTNDEDFDAVADEREEVCAQRRESKCVHDFGMVGVCVKCGASDLGWERVPQLTPVALELASLLSPIREAIYMGDRGQPCACSEFSGKCYMHAQQERAADALGKLHERLTDLNSRLDEKISVSTADDWLSHRFHKVCDERDALRAAVRSALDRWPGGTPFGASYYALADAIGYDPMHDGSER